VRDFLASRGIDLPGGDLDDDPAQETICGLGNRKNAFFHHWLLEHQVRTYPDAIDLVHRLTAAGMRTAIISASRNCEAILENAGVAGLFAVRVDGLEMARLGLPGKPDPAIFLEALRRLEVEPKRAVVVEDALAGVEAGVRGGFGLVIGVDRTGDSRSGHGAALRERGADLVVADLGELLIEGQLRAAAGRAPSSAGTAA
jgi:HAD superfamily hydrolase (TIGR01509 family)